MYKKSPTKKGKKIKFLAISLDLFDIQRGAIRHFNP